MGSKLERWSICLPTNISAQVVSKAGLIETNSLAYHSEGKLQNNKLYNIGPFCTFL
jgi:hypothetical protein